MSLSTKALLFVVSALGPACASRATLHRVVLDYDETVSRAQAEMLLLNVARARHQRPLHFTTVSGIAATFDYRASASLGGELAESPGVSILTPSIGVSASENPTISIVPIQGEEFTRRLLTPLDESTLGFFYHQGVEPALLLRLIANAVIVESEGERALHLNDPLEPSAVFERFASVILDVDDRGRLDVGPLVFEETWSVEERAPSANDLVEMIERGYDFRSDSERGVLSRRVVGRHVLTNYDPATLSNEERVGLQRRAQEYPSYFVLVDLRSPSPSEPSLQGWIKLRSLSSIVDATAKAIAPADVRQGRTPLEVVESLERAESSLFSVAYEGLHYAVLDDETHENPTAFRVLYRLYQMAVSELPGSAVPPVTIAK